MFSRVRIAIRFFVVGLAVGMLLAPRSGEETRRLVRQKAEGLLNDVLDAASLGTVDPVGSTASAATTMTAAADAGADEATTPRRTARSTNSSQTRSRPRAATPAS